MSSLRKKALIRLLLCAVMLIVTIVFSVLLLTGTFDGAVAGADPSATAQTGETAADPNARRNRPPSPPPSRRRSLPPNRPRSRRPPTLKA